MSTYERMARYLVVRAARSAPPTLSERLEEEWLADLAQRRAGLPRLRMALGCCWATSVIAREHGALAPAVAPAGGHGAVAHYGADYSPMMSRRTVALFLIASLHVGLIYALVTGVWTREAAKPPETIRATFLDPVARPPIPLPPDPTLKSTTWIDNLPPLPPLPPQPAGADAIEAAQQQPLLPPTPGTAHVIKRVLGGPGPGFPSTDDYYPAQTIRAGVQGAATVHVCVDESGRLSTAPAIEQASGSGLLDAAALRLARAGSGHYRPTTEDGRAVSSCYPVRVRFVLH